MRPPRRRTRRLPAANPAGNPPLNKPVVSEEALGEPVLVPDLPRLASKAAAAGPAYVVLAGISFSHFLNDTMQSLIASVYPILKDNYALDFAQIGMITLAFQFTCFAAAAGGRRTSPTERRSRSRSPSAWASPSSDCCCSASRTPIRSFSSRRRSSALGRRCSIPNPRGSHGLLPAAATALRSRCSSSAAALAPRWGRCWRP